MNTFIALFRGINVGGRNKVAMKDLVLLMHNSGFIDVQYYIQSGNVVFKYSHSPSEEISTLVDANFGFKPDVLILTPEDLINAIGNNPFVVSEGNTCHFYFCEQELTSVNVEKLENLKTESEGYAIAGRVFYLHAPDGVGRSKMAANIEKCIGLPVTARNLNTVRKLEHMVNVE